MNNSKKYFTKTLLQWNKEDNRREMPWKAEKDPYKIWLSEIILQQTRVKQGLDYYNRIIKAYPAVDLLAKAPRKKIFKLWEGLGYYTRCKNLIETAKFIVKEKKGKFPDTYEDILVLKGVGPYTASAIASFAYNLPHAVVDGNVYRVLSRFFGIKIAVNSNEGKKIFEKLANELLDKKAAGIYNQAIMDFGALVCKPKIPLCKCCKLKNNCVAWSQELIDDLPVKKTKIDRRSRWFSYLIIEHNSKFYVRKRKRKDIWENLYEFILLETPKKVTIEKLKSTSGYKEIADKNKLEIKTISKTYRQQLTHQSIQGRFFHFQAKSISGLKGYKAVNFNELKKLPFPKIISAYLAEKGRGI